MNTSDFILLGGSVLMLAGLLAGKVGTRLGVPALLVFLMTGMLFGSAGLGLEYNDTPHAVCGYCRPCRYSFLWGL